MSALLPHLVRRRPVRHWPLIVLATLALAACDPSWQRRGAPVSSGVAGNGDCGGTITVYPGDTVYSISRRCNVSVRELIEANTLAAPYIVTSGMTLRVPGGNGVYVVQRGDTLLVLARKLKVEFQTLARTNGKTPPYTIYVGEKLRVPGRYGGGTQVARTSQPDRAAGPLVIASPNAPGSHAPSTASTATVSRLPPRDEAPPPARVASAGSNTSAGVQTPPPAARNQAFQPEMVLPPPEPPPLAGRGFVWPLKGDVLVEFGPMANKGQNNDGVNIAAPRGTPVRAAENGVVAYSGNGLKGFGNLLLIKHAGGWMTAYAHNDQLMVAKGQSVKKNQQISTVGSTGNVDSPQLHFEIRKGTEAVNPNDYIKGDTISLMDAPGGGAPLQASGAPSLPARS